MLASFADGIDLQTRKRGTTTTELGVLAPEECQELSKPHIILQESSISLLIVNVGCLALSMPFDHYISLNENLVARSHPLRTECTRGWRAVLTRSHALRTGGRRSWAFAHNPESGSARENPGGLPTTCRTRSFG
jgi:hypothetical protein